jgi:hypothetical protein
MSFNLIFKAFVTETPPPTACLLNKGVKSYKFAPLAEDCVAIYTVDAGIWQSINIVKNMTCRIFDDIFCLSLDKIVSMLEVAKKHNHYVVIALTDNQVFHPPGSDENGDAIKLLHWPTLVNKCNLLEFYELGFDIIDEWTGISALTNLDYCNDDLIKLKKLQLQANQFGLLSTLADGVKFTKFANLIAPEHAPFIPVKVLARIPPF